MPARECRVLAVVGTEPSLIAVKPRLRVRRFGVRGADSGIDDVSFHSGARSVVSVTSVERQISLIDSIESPRGASLGSIETDHAILFDKRDARIGCEFRCSLFRHAHGKAFEGARVRVAAIAIAGEIAREAKSFTVDVGNVVFEYHDVLIGNSFFRLLDGFAEAVEFWPCTA